MQPPQQPDGFPNYNDPLPPGPGGGGNPWGAPQGGYPQGGGYSPYGAPAPQLSFDAISEAWRIVQPSIGTYIGALLLTGLVILVSYMPSFIIEMQVQNATRAGSNPAGGLIGLSLIFRLISYVIQQYVTAGLYRMAINHLRNGTADMMDVFSTYDVLPSLIGAAILTTIAIGLGFCLCIIPGMILTGLFMFTIPIIVDQKAGPVDAMTQSYEALKGQMWMAFAYMFVVGLVGAVGLLLCGVGALFTGPIAIMAIAIAYRNFFMVPGAPANPSYPNAPIADPNF